MARKKPLNLRHKVTLLRYKDSGTAMVWLEGGEDKSPCIGIDLFTSIDISAIAAEVAKEKAKENEKKFRFLKRMLATQGLAEFAFTIWYEGEGTELNKKGLKKYLREYKYSPGARVVNNKWIVSVVGTTDYHGDLTVQAEDLYDPERIFIHAIRFGSNEKVLLKGWTTAKYIKLTGIVSSKEFPTKKGKKFSVTKYHMDRGELFPMRLLRPQLKKLEVITKDEAGEMVREEKGDDFGF